jgi:hypothetical protein
MLPLELALLATVFAGYEWWRWATKSPPRPAAVTLVAVLVIGPPPVTAGDLPLHVSGIDRNRQLGRAGEPPVRSSGERRPDRAGGGGAS